MDKYENSAARPPVHWWYDSKEAGVRNSVPSNEWNRRSSLSQQLTNSPSVPGSSGTGFQAGVPVQQQRRDSLRNLIHLCDFATP